jgi:hypothetical protein
MATEGVEGCAHAQPEVAQYLPSGAFSPEVGKIPSLEYYTTYPKTTNFLCNYENKRGR